MIQRRIGVLVALSIMLMMGQSEAKLTQQEKLLRLRNLMRDKGYQAVIIPTEDEHQSEYVAEYDLRREWLTGFSGSAGTAVVTADKAALWTDSRYYLQAEMQLDSQLWTLMKSEPGVPRINQWIIQQLSSGNKVGQSAKFVSINTWNSREKEFNGANLLYENTDPDLIDLIWPEEERPSKPDSKIKIHDIKFAGKTWQQKIQDVQTKLKDASADMFVVTALDEVAWLLNLRAADIPYNPMVFGYVIISREGDSHFYVDLARLDQPLQNHLEGLILRPYTSVIDDIRQFSESDKKIWISPQSSYAIYSSVTNKNNLILKSSPIRSIKARKNDVELSNLRNCHLRDSVARIRHMYWLETEMAKGTLITEKSAARELIDIQSKDSLFATPSFESISAVGKNAAIVHYSTEEGDDVPLDRNKIYLLDAGGQYEDCTTDVTRTHHFGNPSLKERFAYTRVMQGSIDLANVVFPPGVYGRELDVEARSSLWRTGLDYGHGTGHGIGYYLSVHEAPPSISYGGGGSYDETFEKGMIQSDEPGYYEDGQFGIRLETDIETVEAKTQYNFRGRKYLKFEPLTFVPFERNLIDECALTNEQVDWLNKYYHDIREKTTSKLNREEREYLAKKTAPFHYTFELPHCDRYNPNAPNSANLLNLSKMTFTVFFVSLMVFFKLFA